MSLDQRFVGINPQLEYLRCHAAQQVHISSKNRPADAIGLGVMPGKIATGEIEDDRDEMDRGH